MIKLKKVRKVTYTVNIPIQFTFCATNNLDIEEFHDLVVKEARKRLESGHIESGYFDILENDWCIRENKPHFSKEELLDQQRTDQILFPNLRGLR